MSIPGRDVSFETLEEADSVAQENKLPVREDVLKDFDRMTAQCIIHLENCCDKPHSINPKFSAMLESQGVQPYQRKIKVNSTWTPLDCGWVASESSVGMIVFENITDRHELRRQIMLKAKEGEQQSKSLPKILVSVSGNDDEADFEIQPAQFNIYSPKRPHLWRIKSSGDPFMVHLTVYPR